MSPPLLNVEGGVRSGGPSPSVDFECTSKNGLGTRERNYLGFPDCSSETPAMSSLQEGGNKNNLNLKATELRLGLPGSQSPERVPELCLLKSGGLLGEKPLFPLYPSKDGICSSLPRNVVSGNKRGFCDTIEGLSQSVGQGTYPGNSGINAMLSTRPSGAPAAIKKDAPVSAQQEHARVSLGTNLNLTDASNINNSQPAAKAQVVGWPPVRSFRTKTLATTSKSNEEVDGKPGPGPLFVKVSMDGAPFLRKVDLRTYSTYGELSTALEKMFRGFTIGQYGSHGTSGRDVLSESKLKDLLHGSEYVLTYEDKDGDWMLVGDVPWEFFIDTCKKLKIMKGSDAIGLAPRVMEKSKSKN